ncbi:hypothetical protein BDV27DRAFT_144882 [Aspergillus caelatus]|uniref:BZIP domain-containing protein n=1 Tax=Aspergillus caelatus TaxID=61420 RepID=A0A5N7A515_9EURO|nr:uncharacterized protein BDV27DRAFT_144882 [Aspergillus caelatus]KAE8364912.1 hypothetical protein BDV27DRAFT_144882 [Aspergillus caelatus]
MPTKPWTSGRVLTPAQRERKRYKDRISKREKQEKEKNSLKNLQSQVAALHLLLQSQTRLDPGLPPMVISQEDSIGSCPLPPSDLHLSLHDEPPTMLASQLSAASSDSETVAPFRQALGNWGNGHSTAWPAISPSLQDSGSCTILEFTDELLTQWSGLSILDICSDDKLNQDAMIRGVLEGWHFIEDQAYSCPLWKIISQIDERIFIQSGVLTRLTMLSTILKMLVAKSYQNNFRGVPPWYRPRPSQLYLPHNLTADYFAWPGFRERLVFSNCDILTDRFFKYFASCFRLSWPHSISNAYEINPEDGLYSFSEAFSLHLVDLSKWKMCKAFFSIFPTLEEDMSSENLTSPSFFTLPPESSLPVLPI